MSGEPSLRMPDAGSGLQARERLARLVLAVAFAAAAAALLVYVRRTYANVIFLDGIQLLPSVEDFFSGDLTLGKLFVPYGEHRIPFYRLLLIANAATLHLNMLVDPVLTALASLVTALVLWTPFRRSFTGTLSPIATAVAFLPVLAACVSLVAPPVMLMSTQFQLASVLALVVGRLVCSEPVPAPRVAAAVALTVLYFVGFSGGYFPGLLAALAAVVAARLVAERRWRRAEVALLAIALVAAAVYSSTLLRTTDVGESLGGKLVRVFTKVELTARFFLAGFAATVIDLHSAGRFPDTTVLVIGAAVLGFTVLAIHLFFRSRMGERTYLPLWMIGYSSGIMAAVRVGRGDGGWNWMMNEWYAFHLKLVPVGIGWIVAFAAARRRALPARESVIALAFAAFAAVTWTSVNAMQWRHGVHVKRWVELRRDPLLFPEGTPEPEKLLLVSKQEAETGRAILVRHRLNVFADGTIQRTAGWWPDGWIGREARAVVPPAPGGCLRLAGQLPATVFERVYGGDLAIELIVDGQVVSTRQLSSPAFAGGAFTLQGAVPRDRASTVVIRASKAFVPAQHAELARDARELSLLVESLTVQ